MGKLRKVLIILPQITLILAGMFSPFTRVAYATEIIVTGNGDGSTSEVNTAINSTTSITQNNDANVNNDINSSASTGGNEANGNVQAVSIQTGNINNSVEVNNNLNNSIATIDCCPSNGSTFTISANGTESVNSIEVNSESTNTYSINQTAIIRNNILGYSNTGGNSANNNSGSVSIETGNIDSKSKIINDPINQYYLKAGVIKPNFSALVSENGAGSENYVSLNILHNNSITINNFFSVDNNLDWQLVTGDNTANNNLGNVFIKTGNIMFDTVIRNAANIGGVNLTCCKAFRDDQDPPDDEEIPDDKEVPDDEREATPTPKPTNGIGGSSVLNSASSDSGGVSPSVLGLSDTSSPAMSLIRLLVGTLTALLGFIIVSQKLYAYKKALQIYIKV